jgi:predicted acetyltransferase
MKLKQTGSLTLRWASRDDIDGVVAFDAAHLHPTADGQPNPRIANRIRAWMDGSHPLAQAEDVTLVVDVKTGQIVSSQALMCQPWQFDELPIDVGQIEFVATHPDYRRRGLVREQMAVMHQRCQDRGWLMQVITGIPSFYRQFGYALALEKGGGRRASRADLADIAKQSSAAYRVRSAQSTDIPFLIAVDALARRRSLVSCVRDEALWQYELNGRTSPNIFLTQVNIIETAQGEPVGYLVHPPQNSAVTRWVQQVELAANVPWLAVVPCIMRYLLEIWDESAAHIGFWLGSEHPLYAALPRTLSKYYPPDAWYVRVPDMLAFVEQVKSVLENRLTTTIAAGCSGSICLNFFGSGLRLNFDHGRLTPEPWTPTDHEDGDARFPANVFLQLLLGYRSLAELEHAFADCQVDSEKTSVLLNSLFPKRPSSIWWIG